ncbi:MAG TPA: hypothetical protein VGF94_12345 [Kofleriaceae bacterium]|jgi:hypothetical protein
MKSRIAVVMCCALAVGACEKSRSVLDSDDVVLLEHIPGGNFAIVGGNYMKLQNFMQSSLGKMIEEVGAKVSGTDGMTKWMECFAKFPSLHLAGAIALRPSAVDIRMVFGGMKLANVIECANQAGFQTKVDPDSKYVSVSIPAAGTTIDQGYLALDDGSFYMRQSMVFTLPPSLGPSSRADLEADVAAAAKGNAADDKALLALANKVDRRRTFWFAGSALGTAEAKEIGDVYGTVDIDNGIAIDVTVQITDPALADKIETGVAQLKKMADQVPGDLRSAIDGLQLQRDGDRLHVTAKITEAQLAAIAKFGAAARVAPSP